MRGRLTIETVNAALDDIASHAEANSKLMAAARSNSVKAADRKRATTLLHCVAVSRHFISFSLMFMHLKRMLDRLSRPSQPSTVSNQSSPGDDSLALACH